MSYRTARNIARETGDSTYTGKPCSQCGDTRRSTATGECLCIVTRRASRAFDRALRDVRAPHVASSRQVAREAGETFYQGAPCRHGHSGKRYVSKGQCYECQMHTSATRRVDDETRQTKKLWRASNRHKRRAQADRRAALKLATDDGTVTPAALAQLMTSQGGSCAYCIAPVEHLDHATPLARGGAHSLTNVQWLCGPCNIAKGTMTDAEYRLARNVL